METRNYDSDYVSTLLVKISGNIETPPDSHRELFKQSVIDTVLHLMKTENIAMEYIGYKPDFTGIHPIHDQVTAYEDFLFVSLIVYNARLNPLDGQKSDSDLVKTFIDVFEDRTHRHLEIYSTQVVKGNRQRIIEMHSDWKLYLKHG